MDISESIIKQIGSDKPIVTKRDFIEWLEEAQGNHDFMSVRLVPEGVEVMVAKREGDGVGVRTVTASLADCYYAPFPILHRLAQAAIVFDMTIGKQVKPSLLRRVAMAIRRLVRRIDVMEEE